MMKRQIANNIMRDIDSGIYDQYPKLKDRLVFIATKLVTSLYINNSEMSISEVQTLKENDYIFDCNNFIFKD